MKAPKSVWVALVTADHAHVSDVPVDGWTRYVLPPKAKRKARKGEGRVK